MTNKILALLRHHNHAFHDQFVSRAFLGLALDQTGVISLPHKYPANPYIKKGLVDYLVRLADARIFAAAGLKAAFSSHIAFTIPYLGVAYFLSKNASSISTRNNLLVPHQVKDLVLWQLALVIRMPLMEIVLLRLCGWHTDKQFNPVLLNVLTLYHITYFINKIKVPDIPLFVRVSKHQFVIPSLSGENQKGLLNLAMLFLAHFALERSQSTDSLFALSSMLFRTLTFWLPLTIMMRHIDAYIESVCVARQSLRACQHVADRQEQDHRDTLDRQHDYLPRTFPLLTFCTNTAQPINQQNAGNQRHILR
jgi:hypothetical protein